MDNTNKDQNIGVTSGWHAFFSAAVGGSGGAYVCFPFEGLKKRLQTGQTISLHPKELYRGSTAFAVSVTFATVASMSFNNALKATPGYDHSSPTWNAISAVTSGMLGAVVGSTPVENVILKQQMARVSPTQAVINMVRQGGPTRLWVGLPELACREAGFAGAMLWGVDAARNKVLEKTGSKSLAELAGLGVGVVGAAVTQPFDTVATIKQKSDGQLSTTQAVKSLVKNYGPTGFFKGLSQRVLLFTGCAYTIPFIQKIVENWLTQKDNFRN